MEQEQVVFAQKLTDLLELAAKKKNVLEYKDIGDMLKGLEVGADELDKTLDFLEANGIDVLRMSDSTPDDEVLLLSDDDADIEVEEAEAPRAVPDGQPVFAERDQKIVLGLRL